MSLAAVTDFHFLRPLWLLGLLALPLLVLSLRARGAGAQAWRAEVDAHLLEHLLVSAAAQKSARSPLWLAAAALCLGCLALAGPAWERMPQPLYQNKAARVIALELGESMLAQDVKPSRFERARFRIADILKRSGDAQTALIAYAGDAFVVAPLTDDANTVANLVDSLDPSVMPARGNDTGRAIDLGVQLMRQAGVREGEIVVLADAVSSDAQAAAARAHAGGIRVSVLGIGSGEGAPVPLGQGGFLKDDAGNIVLPKLDTAALSALARAGGGHYANASSDTSSLDGVLGDLKASDAATSPASLAQTERFLDRGPWLVLCLLPLAALGFRRGWLMLLPLALALPSAPAEAGVWRDLWQRPDQQAQAELAAGNAKQAQALARDPDLRGTAAYRAGDFAGASEDFTRADADTNADAEYNRGNALARQRKYAEALKAYDAALKRAPQMEDAQANRAAVEESLKKQKKDSKQQQQKDPQDHQGHPQQQPGNDQAQDSNQSKDGKGDQQGNDKGEKKSSDQNGEDQKGDGKQEGKPQDSQRKDSQSAGADTSGDDKSPAQVAQQGAEADQKSQQQYEQSIDKALQSDTDKPQPPVRLGAREGAEHTEQSQAVEQWLQRVPDDPGGLLRRKFQLEYERRRQGGNQENPRQ
ncbi:MAG: VWA domain-containing protein [Rudaea sp.]